MTNRHPRSTWLVPVALGALAAVAAVVVVLAGRGGPGGDRQDDTAPPAVAVSSDAPTHRSLDQLVAAGDVVVRGTVEAAERGRWFGSGGAGEARVQSRVLTVRVTDVLAGTAPTGDAVLVEEEGWLDDGRPVVVDGTAPVEVGDEAVLFGDPTLGAPPVESWAQSAGTINYEIVTRIGPRVPRRQVSL